jgi:hypothetical protein
VIGRRKLRRRAAQSASIFEAVWPILRLHLREPRTLDDVTAALDVHRAQLRVTAFQIQRGFHRAAAAGTIDVDRVLA